MAFLRFNSVIVLLLILALSGCSMNAADSPSPQAAAPTQKATSGSAPLVTTSITAAATAASENCIVNTAWVIYVVQPGDTLTAISQRTGATIDELAQANCLTDRNRLDRGQELRIPPTPGAAVPLPPATTASTLPTAASTSSGSVNQCPPEDLYPNQGSDFVVITPSDTITADCIRLRPGASVTVAWFGSAEGTVEVTFYRLSAQMTRPDVIGVDNTPADGFSIRWVVPDTIPPSVIYAIGGKGNSDALRVYVE